MDDDLNGLSREQLLAEVKRLRAGIRAHRDSSGHGSRWTSSFRMRAGRPSDGGIALGLDRLVMLICGEESIRQVMAFPKNNRGQELMTQSPAEVDAKQLRELGIKLAGEKKL